MSEDEATREATREASESDGDRPVDDVDLSGADDPEATAGRMVEIEGLLRDQRDATEFEFGREPVPEGEEPPLTVEVVDARIEREDGSPRSVVFTGVDDDRRVEFAVPWPDDVTDESEPLVRLLAWYDMDVDEFASIIGERVPLRLDREGHVRLHVPPIPGAGNRLWFRVKRWGMANGLVTYTPESLVFRHRDSPYSAVRLWLVGVTLACALVATLGLGVVAVASLLGLGSPFAVALLVGAPAATLGAIALVLSPFVAALLAIGGYRWIRGRFFPSG